MKIPIKVLALNHYSIWDPDFRYVPQVLVTDFDGNVDYDIDFTFGEGTIAKGQDRSLMS